MKTFATISVTAIYVFGAVLTYQYDRVLGNAHCWKTPSNNGVVSSIGVSVTWPFYAFAMGIDTVWGGVGTSDVELLACGNRALGR